MDRHVLRVVALDISDRHSRYFTHLSQESVFARVLRPEASEELLSAGLALKLRAVYCLSLKPANSHELDTQQIQP